jgi:hypothetical protein
VGLRAGLDAVEERKTLPQPGFESLPAKPYLVAVLSYSYKKVKLSQRLTNEALRYEDVWGSGCMDPRSNPGSSLKMLRALYFVGSFVARGYTSQYLNQ